MTTGTDQLVLFYMKTHVRRLTEPNCCQHSDVGLSNLQTHEK
jgi:hypothetical protein